MAAEIDFPTNPNDGDIHTENNISWTYILNAGWKKMPVRSYTVAELLAVDPAIPGQIIWVSDATPPTHAASTGTGWVVIGTATPIF